MDAKPPSVWRIVIEDGVITEERYEHDNCSSYGRYMGSTEADDLSNRIALRDCALDALAREMMRHRSGFLEMRGRAESANADTCKLYEENEQLRSALQDVVTHHAASLDKDILKRITDILERNHS